MLRVLEILAREKKIAIEQVALSIVVGVVLPERWGEGECQERGRDHQRGEIVHMFIERAGSALWMLVVGLTQQYAGPARERRNVHTIVIDQHKLPIRAHHNIAAGEVAMGNRMLAHVAQESLPLAREKVQRVRIALATELRDIFE